MTRASSSSKMPIQIMKLVQFDDYKLSELIIQCEKQILFLMGAICSNPDGCRNETDSKLSPRGLDPYPINNAEERQRGSLLP